MKRHPGAISFAPGAPHTAHLDDLDIGALLDTFRAHLRERRGLAPAAADRLLMEYGPSRGIINDLVAGALRLDHGIDVPDDAVVVTVGAQEAMLLVLRALFASAGDLLAVVNPCYVGMTGAAHLLGIPLVPVGEADTADRAGGSGGDGMPGLDRLEEACRRARAGGRRIRALYVAPDFSNPSGVRLDLATRRRLLRLAAQEDFFLLEDMAYGFTAGPAEGLPTLKSMDEDGRVVCIGTFAKICLPGARVGFAVADQPVRGADGTTRPLADHLAALKGMVTVNTSPICQAVIGGMLLAAGGSMAVIGRERAVTYRRNLALLLRELDRQVAPALGAAPPVTWNRPAGGFFVRCRLPVRADTALLETCAAEHGVLWTPMSAFYVGPGGDREIRLSCSYLDPGEIREGVARLAGFFGTLAAPGRAAPPD
ncbi:aminotransferase class I/II-fold pyridoxal phosphate-dependent enzyme [Streptomyces sp. PRKS01-65]|nr:aminotransferase class I/II-fold pyridoxal phosphate-dependent enzyme [Streptomyces harenosi]